MATWLGLIVETQGRSDFWEAVRRHHVVSTEDRIAARVLIECPASFDFDTPFGLAEALSRDLRTTAIGFLAQTTADVHQLAVFRNGQCVRRLDYSRDEGGWMSVEGDPQPFERVYFFYGHSAGSSDDQWPDMLDDDVSDADIDRFEAARAAGDASGIMDLLHPSSTLPLIRLVEHFGLASDAPGGLYKRPSLWRRLLGKS